MSPGVGYLWVPNYMVDQPDQKTQERIHKKGTQEYGERDANYFMTKRPSFSLTNEAFLHSGQMHGKTLRGPDRST